MIPPPSRSQWLGVSFLVRSRAAVLGLVITWMIGGALPPVAAQAADRTQLWAERLASVVAVEFTTETELERQVGLSLGVVVDGEGTVVLPAVAVNPRTAPSQLLDFKVYRPGAATTNPATGTYLGQDAYTGWHFVRIAPEGREGLRPISDFAAPAGHPKPQIAQTVWGIGLRKKDEDFRPYYLSSEISVIQGLPQMTAIALKDVTGPGLPVFDEAGYFVGLGQPGFGESLLLFSRRQRGPDQIVLMDPDECAAFRLAEEILPFLDRVPQNVSGRPLAWLGVGGFQPVDPDVAKYLQLDSQAGLVVSEVLAGSPAGEAGLQERDIVVSLDGEPLPRLKPDAVLPAFVEREVARRVPGDRLRLGILRGTEQREVEVTLAEAPTLPREAPRRYFDRAGFTVRDMVYTDAVERRVDPATADGLIVHFVKPSSPADTAGLRVDDWVQQIDGVEVTTYDEAVERLAAIEADHTRPEFVLLVRRGSETAVLRVRLN